VPQSGLVLKQQVQAFVRLIVVGLNLLHQERKLFERRGCVAVRLTLLDLSGNLQEVGAGRAEHLHVLAEAGQGFRAVSQERHLPILEFCPLLLAWFLARLFQQGELRFHPSPCRAFTTLLVLQHSR